MEKKRKAEEKLNRRKERKAADSVSQQDRSDERTLAQTPSEHSPSEHSPSEHTPSEHSPSEHSPIGDGE